MDNREVEWEGEYGEMVVKTCSEAGFDGEGSVTPVRVMQTKNLQLLQGRESLQYTVYKKHLPISSGSAHWFCSSCSGDFLDAQPDSSQCVALGVEELQNMVSGFLVWRQF